MMSKVKTIKIDGEEYIRKSDIEDAKKEKTNLEKATINLLDENYIMGMGSCELTGDWKVLWVGIPYLKKALKIVEMLSYKEKREDIKLCIAPDKPLCIGDIKGNKFSGIMIAPRIKE